MSTDAGEMQTFEIGAKVLVYLGNGDEAPGTVLAFEDDFGVYAVELDGTKEVTECSPEQMRAAEEPSDDGNIGNSPHYNERLARARSFNSPNSRLSTAAVTIGESSSAPVASAAAEIAPSPPRSCPHCGAEIQTSQVIVEQMRITFPSGAPLGVGLVQNPAGKVVVDSVQPTSAAAAVPISATIASINDTSCEGKSMDDVLAMIVSAKSAGQVTATFLVEPEAPAMQATPSAMQATPSSSSKPSFKSVARSTSFGLKNPFGSKKKK